MKRLKSFPLWPAFIACAAILYFCCFYRYREPFWAYACGEEEISRCPESFAAGLRLQVLELIGLLGTPALIALFLARKSLIFSWVWMGFFAQWTLYVFSHTYGIDGQNGCEACDYGIATMAIVAWMSLVPAIFIFIFHLNWTDANLTSQPARKEAADEAAS